MRKAASIGRGAKTRTGAILIAFGALLAAAAAWASEGELRFKERVPQFSLSHSSGMAASPDGKNLYVTNERVLTVFSRDASSGEFAFLETEQDGIDDPDDAGGVVDGLTYPRDVIVSPDGKTVYAAGYQSDNSIAVFERDPSDGRISFLEWERNGFDDPTDPGGEVNGMFRPDALAISADGKSVYCLTGNGGNSLAVFDRDPASGRLSFLEAEFENVDDPDDPGGVVDGIQWGTDVAVSADGGSVYATSYTENKIAVFDRDPAGGEISFVEAEQDGVDDAGDAGPTVNGLYAAEAVAISAGGDFVYVAGRFDSAVAMFKRDSESSELEFVEAEVQGVDDAGDAGGTVTGLGFPKDLVTSPTGGNVYVAGTSSNEIASFRLNAGQDEIVFVDSEQTVEQPSRLLLTADGVHAYVAGEQFPGLGVLARLPATNPTFGRLEALFSGPSLQIDDPRGVAVSPDGAHLVTTPYGSPDAVYSFTRNPESGSLTSLVDIELDETDDPSDAGGEVDFLEEPKAVTFSPDGKTVYVTDTSTYAVHVFAFDQASGELSYLESEREGYDDPSDPGGEVLGTYEPYDVEVSPDGTSLYTLGESEDTLADFARDPATGRLSFLEFEEDGVDGVEGLLNARSLDISPDGKNIYVGDASSADAVAVFSRDPATGLVDLPRGRTRWRRRPDRRRPHRGRAG